MQFKHNLCLGRETCSKAHKVLMIGGSYTHCASELPKECLTRNHTRLQTPKSVATVFDSRCCSPFCVCSF